MAYKHILPDLQVNCTAFKGILQFAATFYRISFYEKINKNTYISSQNDTWFGLKGEEVC